MRYYIGQRLLLLPFLLLVYSFVIFAIIQAPPGDFLTSYVATLSASGTSISAEQVQALRHEYGLDQSFIVQYLRWLENLLSGNLGLSLEYQRPNAQLIGEQLVLTVVLAFMSFIFTWMIALPTGIYSATHQRSIIDHALTVINYVGVATPNFMLALVLMWIAFAYFGISVTGLFSPEYVDAPWSLDRVIDLTQHIWLPAVVLGVAGTARLTRIMRANLLDDLNKPYVITARAKGMREWRLVLRYPVRLALNPLVSTIGWYLPQLFSGSLIVATVMNLPNIGPLLLRALVNRDMYLAGAILLIYSFLTIVGTLLSDVLLALIDPRCVPSLIATLVKRCRKHRCSHRPRKSASRSPPTGRSFGGASASTTSRWPACLCSAAFISSCCAPTSSAPRTPSSPTRAKPSYRSNRSISLIEAASVLGFRRSSAGATH